MDAIALGAALRAPLTDLDKGAPGYGGPVPLDATGMQGWNVLREDLPLPVAVIRDSALRENSSWMRRYLSSKSAGIAPHGKTTMAPGLFKLQLDDGAWGMTLSTPHQIRVAREMGLKRIFVANQLLGKRAVEYVFHELDSDPDVEVFCLVDSLEIVAHLDQVGRGCGASRPLKVLVEVGFEGGRTGCRSNSEALAVARAASSTAHLRLCGVEGFEGLIQGNSPVQRLERVRDFLGRVASVARACSMEGLFAPGAVILTAGGSSFFDVVVDVLGSIRLGQPTVVVVRSGCYLTQDSLMYKRAFDQFTLRDPGTVERLGELKPALEVWTYVQSRPEDRLAIAMLGKRDISHDEPPVPLAWHRPACEAGRPAPAMLPDGHSVRRLDDQHCYMDLPPGSPLQVGDMIGFGVSHPCLTFDKWRVIHRIDEGYNVLGSFRTFF